MKKAMMTGLLLVVSVCFTGCGGPMASPAQTTGHSTQQMQGMNMGN